MAFMKSQSKHHSRLLKKQQVMSIENIAKRSGNLPVFKSLMQ